MRKAVSGRRPDLTVELACLRSWSRRLRRVRGAARQGKGHGRIVIAPLFLAQGAAYEKSTCRA